MIAALEHSPSVSEGLSIPAPIFLAVPHSGCMSFQQDIPWPSASSSLSEAPSYFPSGVDQSNLLPNAPSQYTPSSSFHVVQGSELPKHPRGSTPPSPTSPSVYPGSRRTTSISAGAGGSPLPRTRSGPLPLTSSSTIVRSSPTPLVRPEEIWREILKTAYGRDKAFVSSPINTFYQDHTCSKCTEILHVRKFYNIRCGCSYCSTLDHPGCSRLLEEVKSPAE